MAIHFEFSTAARILFGRGKIHMVARLAQSLGQRPLLVTGRDGRRATDIRNELKNINIVPECHAVTGEPTIETVVQGAQIAISKRCDLVIGIGGGSVIDAAKAIAALIRNRDDVMNYLEVIGLGKPLTREPVPVIAVPTTAGTGAEVTANAVLSAKSHRIKVSLRHPGMLPAAAVVDPELTVSMPPHITAGTGMDALVQVLEPYVSRYANPLTDSLCREALRRVSRSFRKAWAQGADVDAREDMSLVSLFGGLALANAKLGAVHGFAAAVGGMFDAPHGLICARLLPFVMAMNIKALRERGPADGMNRYETASRLLTGEPDAPAESGIEWVAGLCDDMKIPELSRYGVTPDHFTEVVVRAQRTSSIKGNPVELTTEELAEVLRLAVG
ncbi:MAG: iron-containing alcohol dehydrogenase [Thermodesulfobacteriota bacterium]